MQFNVDITVRPQTKPTLHHQDLKSSLLNKTHPPPPGSKNILNGLHTGAIDNLTSDTSLGAGSRCRLLCRMANPGCDNTNKLVESWYFYDQNVGQSSKLVDRASNRKAKNVKFD